MDAVALRAKGVGNDKLTNPHCYLLRRKYSRSYFAFRPDTAPFWVVLIILRKFFIAVTSVVFTMSASFQMAACLLVMFCAYGLQVRVSPYMSPSDYDAVLRHHAESAFTSALHARLRSAIAHVESRGRRRTPGGKVDRSALLGVLGSWVFNYNTIESVMLFAAGEYWFAVAGGAARGEGRRPLGAGITVSAPATALHPAQLYLDSLVQSSCACWASCTSRTASPTDSTPRRAIR